MFIGLTNGPNSKQTIVTLITCSAYKRRRMQHFLRLIYHTRKMLKSILAHTGGMLTQLKQYSYSSVAVLKF